MYSNDQEEGKVYVYLNTGSQVICLRMYFRFCPFDVVKRLTHSKVGNELKRAVIEDCNQGNERLQIKLAEMKKGHLLQTVSAYFCMTEIYLNVENERVSKKKKKVLTSDIVHYSLSVYIQLMQL